MSDESVAGLELVKPLPKLSEAALTKLIVETLKLERRTFETLYDTVVKLAFDQYGVIVTLKGFSAAFNKLRQGNQVTDETETTVYFKLGATKRDT